MKKKIRNLTVAEEQKYCAARGKQFLDAGKTPRESCEECPMRWGRHCPRCAQFMATPVYKRMLNEIGNREIEI